MTKLAGLSDQSVQKLLLTWVCAVYKLLVHKLQLLGDRFAVLIKIKHSQHMTEVHHKPLLHCLDFI
jgi:hypothetical protein